MNECDRCLHEKKNPRKYRIVTDLPILDIISVIIGLMSMFVTIFIAMGIIHFHRRVKTISSKDDDDDEDKDEDNRSSTKK